MLNTRVSAKSPTKMLNQNDREIGQLFAEFQQLEESDSPEKEGLLRGIEQHLLYPDVRDEWTAEAEDAITETVEDHLLVKTLLEEMSGLEAESEQFEATMKVLRENAER